MQRILTSVSVALVLGVVLAAAPARADIMTNSLVALEATSNNMMSLLTGDVFSFAPATPQTLGEWTGSITSAGWTLQFTGVVDSVAAQITETGTDGAGQITWFDSGSLGANVINASGGFTLDSQTATAFSGDWVQCCANGIQMQTTTATGKQLGTLGSIISKMNSPIFCNCYSGDNPFFWQYFADVVSTVTSGGGLSSTNTLAGPSSLFDVEINESGSINLSTGAVSLDAVASTAIPEPSTLTLLATILALFLGYHAHRVSRGLGAGGER